MTRYAVLVADLAALHRAAPLATSIALRDGHVPASGPVVPTVDGPAAVLSERPQASARAFLALLWTVHRAKLGRPLHVYAENDAGHFDAIAYLILKDKPP